VTLFVRAAAWLALLGPLFFATYNFASAQAAARDFVPVLRFAWEAAVPFWPWTIWPYWSSDLLYALSFFLCRSRAELDRHGRRLLFVQLFSTACFLLFPLRIESTHAPVTGATGWLFAQLAGFDRPFNAAPSLHVSLAVILWSVYRERVQGGAKICAAAWFLLIGASTLTTYQHHFIDVPTGLWTGVLTLALFPVRAFPASRRRDLAAAYGAVALLLTALAFTLHGWVWIALWPAGALSLVAAAYFTGDAAWLCKQKAHIAFWMWPYTLGASVNARLWTRGEAPHQHLAHGVWIGRAPLGRTPFASVIDLTAEMPVPQATAHVPILDLTVPRPEQLAAAVAAIETSPRPTLVCCALGYSRSATAAAAWLHQTGRAASAGQAIALVRQVRPQIILGKEAAHRVQACGAGSH